MGLVPTTLENIEDCEVEAILEIKGTQTQTDFLDRTSPIETINRNASIKK